MTNCATPKASAGISTMVTMSGSQLANPPERATAGEGAFSAFSSGLTSSSGMKSVLQIHEVLENFIARGYSLGVCLEAALRSNEVGELAGQVHVGHFQ